MSAPNRNQNGPLVRHTSGRKTDMTTTQKPAETTTVATPVATTRKRTRANGEGGVRHDKARDRWVGTITTGYDSDGRQLRRSVTGPTKKAVLDRMRESQTAADAGQTPAPRDLTVAKFLDSWLRDVLPGTVAPATLTQYRIVVDTYIVPTIGQKRLRALTPVDVAVMIRKLGTEYERKQKDAKGNVVIGVSPHTQRIARSVLRRALRWAEQEGSVSRNVAAIAPGVRIDADEGRTLTPEQARALLATLEGDRLEAAFTVALSLGLRLGELLGLAWSDIAIDSTPTKLTVSRALKRIEGEGLVLQDTKTRSSRRTVYLPAQVVAALKAHRKRQVEEQLKAGPEWDAMPLGFDLVFRTPFGTALDPANFRHACYSATKRAGLGEWSPHELRHSCASLLIAQGVPLKVISELLGHSSIRMTADTYGHLLEPSKAEAADAMQSTLWG